MPETKHLKCNSCGHKWPEELPTKEERKKLEHTPLNLGPIHCPKCNRTDIKIEK